MEVIILLQMRNTFSYRHEGVEPPPRIIINDLQIFAYIKDFGTQPGDLGIVAEQNGQVIGAAWTRIIPAYGHINDLYCKNYCRWNPNEMANPDLKCPERYTANSKKFMCQGIFLIFL